MGHGRHIGRLAAIAVALGLGVAVASGPGLAWADDPVDGTSEPTAETAPTPDPEPPAAGDGQGGSDAPSDTGSAGPDVTTTTTDSQTTTVIGGNDSPSVTVSGSTVDTSPEGDAGAAADAQAAAALPDPVPAPLPPNRLRSPRIPFTAPQAATGPSLDERRRNSAPTTALGNELWLIGPPDSVAPPPEGLAGAGILSSTALSEKQPTTQGMALFPASPPASTDPVKNMLAIPAKFASAALTLLTSSFTDDGSGTPPQNPVLWILLAWVRRQSQETAAEYTFPFIPFEATGDLNDDRADGTLTVGGAPVIVSASTSEPGFAGSVMVTVVTRDAGEDPPTVTVTKPAGDQGVVTPVSDPAFDEDPATFTYTFSYFPDAQAQVYAYANPDDADHVTLTVSVSDGVDQTTEGVPVVISPLESAPVALIWPNDVVPGSGSTTSIAVDQDTGHLYAAVVRTGDDGRGESRYRWSVIDFGSGTELSEFTLPPGILPANAAVADRTGNFYGAIAAFDSEAGTLDSSLVEMRLDGSTHERPLAGLPRALAVSPDGTHVYAKTYSVDDFDDPAVYTVEVFDSAGSDAPALTTTVLASESFALPYLTSPMAADSGGRVYTVSDVDTAAFTSTISVVDGSTVEDTIDVPGVVETIAASPDGHHVFARLISAESLCGPIGMLTPSRSIVDLKTADVVAEFDSLELSDSVLSTHMAVSSDGSRVLLVGQHGSFYTIVDTTTGEVRAQGEVVRSPYGDVTGAVFSNDDRHAYVSFELGNIVEISFARAQSAEPILMV